MREMGVLIETAQRNVLAGIPRSTQSNYPQLIAAQIGDPDAWVATQIDRRRLTPKKKTESSLSHSGSESGDWAHHHGAQD
jgi:hypothetical protein